MAMMPTDPGHCKSVAPIMPTTDVARTVAWYRAAGFAVEVHDGGFVMTKRDDIELFLSLNPEHDPKRTAACVYVRVDDADALHAKWRAMAVAVRQLRNTDYRMREFALIDPDGNMMLFGSPLPA
ncbi:MAG TPA: VOC family protein [Rhizomicrobium sp.]|jgi:hypothetical protein|nr:VOC family protein [Rhizomicrobium sp.]